MIRLLHTWEQYREDEGNEWVDGMLTYYQRRLDHLLAHPPDRIWRRGAIIDVEITVKYPEQE